MANIILFPGNSHKAPQEERLTTREVPIRKGVIDEVDVSVASIYPHAVRAHQALNSHQAALVNVAPQPDAREVAAHPRYQHSGTENNPSMAQLAREAIEQATPAGYQGIDDAQKAA